MKQITLTPSDIHQGPLILVNRQYAFRPDETALLVPVQPLQNDVLLAQRARVLFAKLMETVNGWQEIVAVSGWRSHEAQKALYTQSVHDNGTSFTEKFVAVPGHSEHETGLAIDVGLRQETIDFIRPAFPDRGTCARFKKRASQFGFILRYPEGKETVTGIAHEPWHFRYVGMPHAEIMERYSLTLEEYHDFLKRYTDQNAPYLYEKEGRRLSVCYIKGQAEKHTHVYLDNEKPYAISGNNMDGFVLTQWSVCHGHA